MTQKISTWKSKYGIYGTNWTKYGTEYGIYGIHGNYGFYGLGGHTTNRTPI